MKNIPNKIIFDLTPINGMIEYRMTADINGELYHSTQIVSPDFFIWEIDRFLDYVKHELATLLKKGKI